jgi:hypothetical protein
MVNGTNMMDAGVASWRVVSGDMQRSRASKTNKQQRRDQLGRKMGRGRYENRETYRNNRGGAYENRSE